MSASELLSSLINDAWRNNKPEVEKALQLLRDPILDLEIRYERLERDAAPLWMIDSETGQLSRVP